MMFVRNASDLVSHTISVKLVLTLLQSFIRLSEQSAYSNQQNLPLDPTPACISQHLDSLGGWKPSRASRRGRGMLFTFCRASMIHTRSKLQLNRCMVLLISTCSGLTEEEALVTKGAWPHHQTDVWGVFIHKLNQVLKK